MSHIMEFRNVRFNWHRKDSPLFPSLDMQVPAGIATALLGPNGAGKTTIMDLSLGWRTPQSGEILLQEYPINQWSHRKRGQFMALVPQDEIIQFDYSVLEYILLGRSPYLPPLGNPGQEDRRIALEALEEAGIDHLVKRKVSRLSGGERQLVLLARALTQQPKLLLLDEPASHLDLHNREKILHILEKLKQRGISIFFTSHDPELVIRLADHAILLKNGSVIQCGPSESILNDENLTDLYNIPVKIGTIEGQRVLIWGQSRREPG
ncbi:ABC transporter ATP-binding protein [Oceanispirochaeta sp.]|jgi:iron complex transport system ATP-binding protein|uniref:ABC transporter ATP-binding protein n=1 Tax=Oceanispirochaeta sp. TaxID=2035350 RepID=UPI00260A2EAB|nr:ABC transporter ATP-binding protein [Oceanispirochaeta sp.]MDA3958273.1 ABC transporter ATP-binding protein [Oceanispirochaeta sp.]